MGFLTGKKILITGVLSNRSIAYGIAKACHREGAELAFTYVSERFKERITGFAAEFNSQLIFDCDVSSDEQIAQLFTQTYAIPASGKNPAAVGVQPVVFATPPTIGATYFVVSFDSVNGADLWMVNNLAPLTTVDQSECLLVGHLSITGNLWSALNSSGAIVL